ncbi:MAG: riboflavin biosynthesis protein RibF [Rhodospirillaceae bacterium TMED8]|nr:riboflavin biosynthesis protein RibF [Magnetovibrio sp.]OUT47749.1 MAG: riboflavin biosynthesis protein RibF [Rhodospirillaceae bacterium TMED8]|tara:strand:+ start:2653 stop:3609 length:957 start_codon:yes stop_codon:yes gene_type:complete
MRIYRHFKTLPEEVRGAVIAVGNFDGVHLGHQAVINEAGKIARADNRPWAVLTFEPHPRRIFQSNGPAFRLTSIRAKARHLAKLGVEVMIVQRFNHAFSTRPAEDFVKSVLVDGFGAKHIVAGYDFVFGHNRSGNCETLLTMGQEMGFGFTAVSAKEDENGEIFSSTRIRECIASGDVASAAKILGRPFEIEGRVSHGDERGRTIGFPTLNLYLRAVAKPAFGVYAAQIEFRGRERHNVFNGIANVGIRPTFGNATPLLEAYIFDFNEEVYGKLITVSLIERIRAEKKFDGIDALRAQITIDCKSTRRIFRELRARKT